MVLDLDLPTPAEMDVEVATYLRGMAEAAGELRRRCLDILRKGYSVKPNGCWRTWMRFFAVLMTWIIPMPITYGLRHQSDQLRVIIERTRADLTISLREHTLQQALIDFEKKLPSWQSIRSRHLHN